MIQFIYFILICWLELFVWCFCSILDNHDLTIADWETRISNWHLKLRDVPFLDSIVEYVDTAQDVELYGASIFDVEDSNRIRKCISLDAVGLNVFDSKRYLVALIFHNIFFF